MKYDVFYGFYATGESVSSDAPIEMEHADIYSKIFGRLEKEGDFFGIIDKNENTFQVMYHADDDAYWAEIPAPDEKGSYGAFLDFDDMVDLMKELPETFEPSRFPQLEFEAW